VSIARNCKIRCGRKRTCLKDSAPVGLRGQVQVARYGSPDARVIWSCLDARSNKGYANVRKLSIGTPI